jgi:multiple sugar transport system permease protein
MKLAAGAGLAARYALALAVLAIFLFPLYWLLITALKAPPEIRAYPPVWWPGSLNLRNFADLLVGTDAAAIAISIIVASVSTILAVVLGTIGAYVIARTGLRGQLFAGWAVASRMVPPVLLASAFFLLYTPVGRADSIAVLILLLGAFNLPYVLWMMRGYFRDIPAGLEEAALVAGLKREQLPRQVAWPMVRGGFIATAAFTFVLAWNELAFALVLAQDAATTWPAQLAQYDHRPELWGKVAALGVIGTLPVLVALALTRRRLARSLSLGFVRD